MRITTRSGDHAPLTAFLSKAIPYYESLPGVRVRLLRHAQDPGRFIEVIEYDTVEAFELDEGRVRDDPQMTILLQEWRGLLVGDVEVETYDDISSLIPK